MTMKILVMINAYLYQAFSLDFMLGGHLRVTPSLLLVEIETQIFVFKLGIVLFLLRCKQFEISQFHSDSSFIIIVINAFT